ncbi:MAG: site-2 protease family protein [Thermoplasmatota archaeon]
MKYSIKIARIKGIPINVHVSFLFIFLLFAVILSIQTFNFQGIRIGFGEIDAPVFMRWILGVITAITLFFFLFLHELAHSLVSISLGYRVKEITFFLLGGVSNSEGFPEDPTQELKIAAIGPVVSLGIGGMFMLSNQLVYLAAPSPDGPLLFLVIFLGSLGFYNILIGLFNLIPAFPLDGGRILRSLLGYGMDHRKATIRAAQTGKVVAVILGIVGLIIFNLILIFIAVFIYMGAKSEKDMTETMGSLEGLKVKDIMSKHPGNIAATASLEDVRRKMIKNKRAALIVKRDGGIMGIVTAQGIKGVPKEERGMKSAKDIMEKDYIKADPGDEGAGTWKQMIRKGKDRVVVTRKGKVLGMASQKDFVNMVKIRSLFR